MKGKKLFAGFLTAVCAGSFVLPMAACNGETMPPIGEDGMAELTYPDFEETPSDKNSWEYIPEDNDMTIEWYVDVSSWPIPAENDVLRKIKEDTGISIHFTTPVQDDGQKLSTMIAGGDLPDVISTTTSKTQTLASLAQQGYVYDINTLADKWAPTLYDHLPEDVMDWWAYGNNKTYGIPNHYYSYEDIPEGEQLQPNGGMMVRKDLFDAWQAHAETLADSNGMISYEALDGSTKSVEWQGYITTPEGFKAAATWAMSNYYGTGNGQITTALQLSQFTDQGNASLEWLAQFFAIPFETRDGKYEYRFTQEEYAEMLYWLNDLCSTRANGNTLISRDNFTQTYDGVGSVIAGGKAFATLATPQDYQMHFATAKDGGYEYVSMYITNSDGDAPVLADIRGYGYLMNMITTDCERPDLVIKLFDYLSSDEGQRLVCFGVEGETWNWTDEEEPKIAYTEDYLELKGTQGAANLGLMTVDLLLNYQYYDNVQPRTNHGKTEAEVFRANLKRPLSVYAYDYNATHFVVDATDDRFQDYNNALTRINALIGQQTTKILQATSRSEAEQIYRQTVELLEKRNLALVIELNSEAYQATKEKLGITVAWPAWQEGYVNPLDRTQPNGDLSLYRTY
ncbi:MAG TPA: hypothetical protein H9676_07310 [Firmicutes bacterium]|nr:hypothetical protein [Bacillota bacterium]